VQKIKLNVKISKRQKEFIEKQNFELKQKKEKHKGRA